MAGALCRAAAAQHFVALGCPMTCRNFDTFCFTDSIQLRSIVNGDRYSIRTGTKRDVKVVDDSARRDVTVNKWLHLAVT